MPAGAIRAWAIFAHCFTCSKDGHAARRISAELAKTGIAVLRFDFTGLGSSDGDFASTNFSSNVDDLRAAADWLGEHHQAPQILIGHSLGGAAVLAAAGDIESVRAVVTIGAPADVSHVIHNLGAEAETIWRDGESEVSLAGRKFTLRRQFLEDVRNVSLAQRIATLHKPLMILHAPRDEIVGIDNAAEIFKAARHPKSYVSLDNADHLLSEPADAAFASGLIAAWVARYVEADSVETSPAVEHVSAGETGQGRYQISIQAGRHRFIADEPASAGGGDTGPNPYDLMSAALGACTAMTLRMYASFKKLDLGLVSVKVTHDKVHAADCRECEGVKARGNARIDRFERVISVDGEISPEIAGKLIEIAGKCPVHRTLEGSAAILTKLG